MDIKYGSNMNSNYDQKVFVDTKTLKWEAMSAKGVFKKLLSSKDDTQTALIKLEENTVFSHVPQSNSVEIFVLEGTYINEFGEFSQGTYLRLPKEDESLVKSIDGCMVFRKINYFDDNQTMIVDTSSSQWLSGHGNLEVLPLHQQTALVKWPKNEKFAPHKHWGGEEIFVLKGVFMDEHGQYPQASWIRSPHLSIHFPYVEEETIIFVKTGHL